MCRHNQKHHYTHGFLCEDCNTFFPKESDVYRSSTLLDDIWMVLNNISVDKYIDGKGQDMEALEMRDKIGIGVKHDDYESLIAEAEVIMDKNGVNAASAVLIVS